MSEPYYIPHKCECTAPKLGIVDGDTDMVYCANCEGSLGELGDVELYPSKSNIPITALRSIAETIPVANRSGKPNSCHCYMFPTVHSHLKTDGESHNIRPDIQTKGATND